MDRLAELRAALVRTRAESASSSKPRRKRRLVERLTAPAQVVDLETEVAEAAVAPAETSSRKEEPAAPVAELGSPPTSAGLDFFQSGASPSASAGQWDLGALGLDMNLDYPSDLDLDIGLAANVGAFPVVDAPLGLPSEAAGPSEVAAEGTGPMSGSEIVGARPSLPAADAALEVERAKVAELERKLEQLSISYEAQAEELKRLRTLQVDIEARAVGPEAASGPVDLGRQAASMVRTLIKAECDYRDGVAAGWRVEVDRQREAHERAHQRAEAKITRLESVLWPGECEAPDGWAARSAALIETTLVKAAKYGWMRLGALKDPILKQMVPRRYDELKVAIFGDRDGHGPSRSRAPARAEPLMTGGLAQGRVVSQASFPRSVAEVEADKKFEAERAQLRRRSRTSPLKTTSRVA